MLDPDQRRSTLPPGAAPSSGTLLSDRPLAAADSDRLGYAAYADALAGIIGDASTDTPLTIAISAAWGAGKTSLAKMIEARLQDEVVFPRQRNITCWFNAWMNDDAPNLGTAFAAKVARDINGYRPAWRRIVSPLPAAFYSPQERWRHRIVMALVSVMVVALAALVPSLRMLLREMLSGSGLTGQVNRSLSAKWASAAILIVAIIFASRRVFAAAQAAARFIDDPQSEAAKGSMQSVHDQLAGLIRQAAGRRQWRFWRKGLPASRLIIFVDDLERCRPPRAVDVCEIANQLLSVVGVVTVMIGDMQVIATSAAMKYLPNGLDDSPAKKEGSPIGTMSPFAYGHAYLEKMIQIQFNVPVSGPAAVRHMLASIDGQGPGVADMREQQAGEPLPETDPVSAGQKQSASRDGVAPDPLAEDLDAGTVPARTATANPASTGPASPADVVAGSPASKGGAEADSTRQFVRRVTRLNRISDVMGPLMGVSLLGVWTILLTLTSMAGWEAFLSGLAASFAVMNVEANVEGKLKTMTWHEPATPQFVRRVTRLNRISDLMWPFAVVSVLGVWAILLALTSMAGWKAFLSGLGAALGIAMVGGHVDGKLERMTGHGPDEIDSYIREISGEASSIEELRVAVQRSSAARNVSADLVDQRLQSYLVDESNIRHEAEATVAMFAPALPRGAKRAINQLRVTLAVAGRRRMFDSSSPLKPQHVGKWVVLAERWPELAMKLTMHPRDIRELESLHGEEMRAKVLAWAPNVHDVDGMCALLDSTPKLEPVLDHLVRFEPWGPPTAAAAEDAAEDGQGARIPAESAQLEQACGPEHVAD